MLRSLLGLIVVFGITCGFNANAASVATITAIKSIAWIKQGNTKFELSRHSVINFGDHIITSETGKIEMRLEPAIAMQIDINSEISIHQKNNTENPDTGKLPEVSVHKGQLCIQFNSKSPSAEKIKLNIGDSMFVSIDFAGEVCVIRQEKQSQVNLLKGSIQVTHAVNPDLIVLSVPGTSFRIDDKGEYRLLVPGSEVATVSEQKPVATIDTTEAKADDEAVAVTEPQPAATEQTSDYIYTVYLFSTRSEDVAKRVNKKLRDAGYKTQIIITKKDSVSTYRIAVSGFTSRQTANEFSSSIIGKLGISDTWIGKQKNSGNRTPVY